MERERERERERDRKTRATETRLDDFHQKANAASVVRMNGV